MDDKFNSSGDTADSCSSNSTASGGISHGSTGEHWLLDATQRYRGRSFIIAGVPTAENSAMLMQHGEIWRFVFECPNKIDLARLPK
jgi:ribose 5-phosphate isomerase